MLLIYDSEFIIPQWWVCHSERPCSWHAWIKCFLLNHLSKLFITPVSWQQLAWILWIYSMWYKMHHWCFYHPEWIDSWLTWLKCFSLNHLSILTVAPVSWLQLTWMFLIYHYKCIKYIRSVCHSGRSHSWHTWLKCFSVEYLSKLAITSVLKLWLTQMLLIYNMPYQMHDWWVSHPRRICSWHTWLKCSLMDYLSILPVTHVSWVRLT